MSGIAVAFAEVITSLFIVLVMLVIWKKHIILAMIYICCISSVELLYLSSVLYKFPHGGYFPVALATIFLTLMIIWNYVYRKKYFYELEHKVSPNTLKDLANTTNVSRIPGLAIFYSELVNGIPPIFGHYIDNIPALHSVLVFLSIKSLPISTVPLEERFLFRRVNPKELYVFRCVVRYGYTESCQEEEPFERLLVEKLKEFIKDDYWYQAQMEYQYDDEEDEDGNINNGNVLSRANEEALQGEMELVDKAWRSGVVHMMGESEVIATKGSGLGKRIVIDSAYNFLRKNLRQSDKVFNIPRKRLVKVGMTYEL